MTRVWHDSCVCVAWLVCMCNMTHSYRVRGGPHTHFFETWHNPYASRDIIHMRVVTRIWIMSRDIIHMDYVTSHGLCERLTTSHTTRDIIHMDYVTSRVTRSQPLIGAITHTWNDSYLKWLVCVCDMTHSYRVRGGRHTQCPQVLFVRDPRCLLCWEFVIVRWLPEMYI